MNKIPFMRFGGLSPVKQKGYDTAMEGWHSPPARSGFYAFPESQVETFLLGVNIFDQRRQIKLDPKKVKKDEDGFPLAQTLWKNKDCEERYHAVLDYVSENDYILCEEIFDALRAEYEVVAKHCRPKKFYHTGELWHHLKVEHKEVLLERGTWFLTSYKAWEKAFKREVKLNKMQKQAKGYGSCKDGFEVFIEHLKG